MSLGWKIDCTSGSKYDLFLSDCDGEMFIQHRSWNDGMDFLLVEIGRNVYTGLEAFEVLSRELGAMTESLGCLRTGVDSLAGGFLIPDSTSYDGRGVELPLQYGFMTCGNRRNLSEFEIAYGSTALHFDLDCNATICCAMKSRLPDRGWNEVDIRLGSGKGFDEAYANAVKRIESLVSDCREIEEWAYDRLCLAGDRYFTYSSHIRS